MELQCLFNAFRHHNLSVSCLLVYGSALAIYHLTHALKNEILKHLRFKMTDPTDPIRTG